jgi:glycosyltransferase involved in cell wall biosynthesis
MTRKMLFISMCMPFDKASHAGGKTFNFYIKNFAKKGYDIKLITKILPDEEKYVKDIIPQISIYPVSTPKKTIYRYISYFKSLNSKFNPFYKYGNILTSEIYNQIFSHLVQLKKSGYYPDVVVLEWTSILLYIDKVKEIFPNALYISSEHDVTFLGLERKYLFNKNQLKRLYLKFLYLTMKKNELRSINKCDLVVTHNSKDKRLLLENGIEKDKVGVIVPYYEKFPIVKRNCNYRDIIFYGAMNREENYISVIWFIENVIPLLNDIEFRFIVIGNKPPKKLYNYQSDNILITGFVEDPTCYFENSVCLVAPLLLGAGVKVKILEALSSGIPVLTNDIGIEGIDAIDGEDYFHCTTKEDYAIAIKKIFNKELDIKLISYNSKKFIESNYDLDKSFSQYDERIEKLLNEKES